MSTGPDATGVWSPTAGWQRARRQLGILIPVDVLLSIWYFRWLVSPHRVGNPILYGFLLAAETFNLAQAAGFWWTVSRARQPRAAPTGPTHLPVDVLIPVYNEEPAVVEATLAAACRMEYPVSSVIVCDDGGTDEMAELAARYRARYLRRPRHQGAKAGNLNYALAHTSAPLVAVFDCDHVPNAEFLARTVPYFDDSDVALVQTPQYYANRDHNPVAAAAWSQQALFFGIIARGKDALDSMFCCGTNVVFRRAALEAAGGVPEESITEDFELSIHLREMGWRTVYVPEVLASGLGPEDMASYVSQQQRWSRGCLAALGKAARSELPARQKAQFLLSSMYFLTGWTYLVYMALPVVRIVAGPQALASATAAQFLAHFAPYFCASMLTVAVAGQGCYSFAAFALMEANFWIHVSSTLRALFHVRATFVVTPKVGRSGRQVAAVWPAMVALMILVAAALDGLMRSRSPSTLNNVAFAALHIAVLLVGTWPALVGVRSSGTQSARTPEAVAPSAVEGPLVASSNGSGHRSVVATTSRARLAPPPQQA
ncbi:MAG: glycosyltransferase [Acidimicrobiales bacterium]|nr:glycosyltransferase [Acidimicrobiales bacterium]